VQNAREQYIKTRTVPHQCERLYLLGGAKLLSAKSTPECMSFAGWLRSFESAVAERRRLAQELRVFADVPCTDGDVDLVLEFRRKLFRLDGPCASREELERLGCKVRWVVAMNRFACERRSGSCSTACGSLR
jgi:hypothetical protein